MPQFLDTSRVKASQIFEDTRSYLTSKYKQAKEMFTYSSTFGMLLLQMQNLTQMALFYMSQVASELNIRTATRPQTIIGKAQLQGHNPSMGRSAIGEISFAKKGNNETISGNKIYLPNYSRLTCLNNNLSYMLWLDSDFVVIDVNNPGDQSIRIIQGDIDFQKERGDGKDYQSYSFRFPNGEMVDNTYTKVYVNGEFYPIYRSLKEIPFGQPGCYIRFGMDNDIAVFFGSSINNKIPSLGADIEIRYVTTNGGAGNILDDDVLYEMEDTGFDINGIAVDINNSLSVINRSNPTLGSDPEPIELTRTLAPSGMLSDIIYDERSLRRFFQYLNLYSKILIFNEIDGNINLFNCILIPRLGQRMTSNEDYFSFDTSKIILPSYEKDRLLQASEGSGKKSANISIRIYDPFIRKFIIFVKGYGFKNVGGRPTSPGIVDNKIREILSDYMLNNEDRINFIPHSDIVRILDEIPELDAIKVMMISENPEDTDSLGNISCSRESIAVMRGGFTRDGIEYKDTFNEIVNIDIEYR